MHFFSSKNSLERNDNLRYSISALRSQTVFNPSQQPVIASCYQPYLNTFQLTNFSAMAIPPKTNKLRVPPLVFWLSSLPHNKLETPMYTLDGYSVVKASGDCQKIDIYTDLPTNAISELENFNDKRTLLSIADSSNLSVATYEIITCLIFPLNKLQSYHLVFKSSLKPNFNSASSVKLVQ